MTSTGRDQLRLWPNKNTLRNTVRTTGAHGGPVSCSRRPTSSRTAEGDASWSRQPRNCSARGVSQGWSRVRAISTEYGMGYNTLNTFVSNFVVWAGDRLNDEPTRAFVPGWEFSVEDAEEVYSRLGFPGAMGCMDVIHVAWNNCPAPG
ncbi:hypothetical protein RI054_11g56860 [Pseudoscourfieldia marina]